MDIHIEQIRPELTWRLRREVLYPAQKLFEMELDEDADGWHFGAFYNDKLAGVVSLFKNGNSFQFRKLAVSETAQKIGIGRSLLDYITAFALSEEGTLLWCNARTTAIGFYLKYGFIQTRELFSKNGFEYEIMQKALVVL